MLKQNHLFHKNDFFKGIIKMHDFSEIDIKDINLYFASDDLENKAIETNGSIRICGFKRLNNILYRTYDVVKRYYISKKYYQGAALITVKAVLDEYSLFRGKYHLNMLDNLIYKVFKDGGWMHSALKMALVNRFKIKDF